MLLIGSADESLELYIETALELVRHDSCVVLDPQSDDARVGELFALRRAGLEEKTALRASGMMSSPRRVIGPA